MRREADIGGGHEPRTRLSRCVPCPGATRDQPSRPPLTSNLTGPVLGNGRDRTRTLPSLAGVALVERANDESDGVESALAVVVGRTSRRGWGARRPQAARAPSGPQSLAPYVPTPQDVVERMLELAGVGLDDVVYDLGCGDGRTVITAAKKYGAHGVGVDIDPERIARIEGQRESRPASRTWSSSGCRTR